MMDYWKTMKFWIIIILKKEVKEMDKQEILKRQRLRIRKCPGLVLNDHSDMIIQDIAASFLRKFMRLFIIEFYFDGHRQFEFTKKIDNSFEFKAFALNKWADIKDNSDAWKDAFCELYKDRDDENNCSFYEQVTLDDVIHDNDVVGIDYLSIAQIISKYFDVSIIKHNYKQTTAHFEDGCFVDCNEKNIEPNINQTIIRFKFEEEIFTENIYTKNPYVSSEDFYKIAQSLAMFFNGADITVFDETEDKTVKKKYKYDSLSDYASERFDYDNSWCFEFETCSDETEKIQNNALIKVALTPCETEGEIEMYCNYRRIEYGMPFKAIEKALSETNRNFNVVINIFQRYTLWTNAMKRGIENQYIYDSVYNRLKEEIRKLSLWGKVLDYVEKRTPPVAFELWFKTIKFYGINDGKAVLSFKSHIFKNLVLVGYTETLEEAFLSVTGDKVLIFSKE